MLSLLLFTTLLIHCFGSAFPNEGHAQDVFPSEEADPLENHPVKSVLRGVVK